jgi:hypothetical protein
MRLGVPFIAPRQLGAVESIPGRQFLPSVAWRTGQSGAPPDTVRCTTGHCPVHHRTLSGADFFPSLAKPTVGDSEPLAHRTLSGAHRTVRCPSSDRWLGHVSRADRAADRWPGQPLAHRTVWCTPDSPVNFSRTPLITSREQQVCLSQPGASDTVRCTQTRLTLTEQSHL